MSAQSGGVSHTSLLTDSECACSQDCQPWESFFLLAGTPQDSRRPRGLVSDCSRHLHCCYFGCVAPSYFHSCWRGNVHLEPGLSRTHIYRNLPDKSRASGKDSGKGEVEGSWGDILLTFLFFQRNHKAGPSA